MKHYYLDTSALGKKYCPEVGTKWVVNLTNPANKSYIYISSLTLAEFGAAIAVKNRTGAITIIEQQQALKLFLDDYDNQYQSLEPGVPIIKNAVQLTQSRILRGYDAVQLATAIYVRDFLTATGITDFTFVTADNNLITAATAEGLAVENPNNHP